MFESTVESQESLVGLDVLVTSILPSSQEIHSQSEQVDRMASESTSYLNEAIHLAKQYLRDAASRDDFAELLGSIFGDHYNQQLAGELQERFISGNIDTLFQLKTLSSDILGNAQGAFAQSTDTIYIADSLLNSRNVEQITAVFLEEFIHGIDVLINLADVQGDEGDIGSRLFRGQAISSDELAELKQEDDSATIFVNGQAIAIEQSLPTVTLSVADNSAAETNTSQTTNPGNFRFTRTGSTATALTVYYSMAGTAATGTDYNNLTGTVVIPIGATSANVAIRPLNDTAYEGAEKVTLSLKTNSAYVLGTAKTGTVNILDNDKPTLSITANDNSAAEVSTSLTQNPGQFTVTRTGNTASTLTASYTIAGTATKGTDYTNLSGTVTFVAGSSTALISLDITDDTLIENDETVILTLSANATYNIGTNDSATATIVDNDKNTISIAANDNSAGESITSFTQNPGQFTLTRTGNIANALTVYYTIGGTATNGTDYSNLTGSINFVAGSSTALVDIDVIDDVGFEGTENVVLKLNTNTAYNLGTANSATVAIADNDVANITVTAPNGGESLQTGGIYNITWSDNFSENVRIDLYKSGVFNRTIFSSTLSDGSESWSLPSDLGSASDYQIKISNVNNSNVYDWSNGYFTIVQVQPDLVTTNISVPSAVTVGSTVNISTYTHNQGKATAGSNSVRYWLSDDATLNTSTDRYLGYSSVGSLASGYSEYDSFSFTYDPSWGTGTKYIFFEADGWNYVTESNESNNTTYSAITINSSSDWYDQNLQDIGLRTLTRSLASDGNLSRNDMIAVFRDTKDNSVIDFYELTDLRNIVSNYTRFNMTDAVRVLSNKIANSDPANTNSGIGNLYSGSSSTQMENLIGKWFLGTYRPDTTYGYNYASGLLFQNGISADDINQNALGDCYYLATLSSIALEKPSYIQNMFIDNEDNTFTVRFYNNGVADYVTVDRYLPTNGDYEIYAGWGGGYYTSSSNELWVALAEKAYAQLAESGWSRPGYSSNSYSAIEGGWMDYVIRQVTGLNTTSQNATSMTQTQLIDLVNSNKILTVGFVNGAGYGVEDSHAYTITSYNAANGTFHLRNPWGSSHADITRNQLVALQGWIQWSNT